jgi:simple sugar transport system substrate-binding protein
MTLGMAVLSASLIAGCGKDDNKTSGTSGTPGAAPTGARQLKVVGFSQEGAESDWRKANTLSMQNEAKKRGIELKFTDAQQKPEKQITDIRSLISQDVDLIVFAPLVKTGWEQVLQEAKDAHIPVIIEDRKAEVPPELYACYIGSDFVEEGRRAARWLGKTMPNGANIAVIEGQQGSDAAEGRKQGFNEALKEFPKLKVVRSQTGEFDRGKGKEVMAAFLKSEDAANPIQAVFAHNDDMALGAIQAIKEAGKKPGKDIIIVSVDGIKGAFEAMLNGELNCSVECNPLLGPQVFDLAEKVAKGEEVPKTTYSIEQVYDAKDVTKEIVDNRKY